MSGENREELVKGDTPWLHGSRRGKVPTIEEVFEHIPATVSKLKFQEAEETTSHKYRKGEVNPIVDFENNKENLIIYGGKPPSKHEVRVEAILKGFPPSNTISPTIRIPLCQLEWPDKVDCGWEVKEHCWCENCINWRETKGVKKCQNGKCQACERIKQGRKLPLALREVRKHKA